MQHNHLPFPSLPYRAAVINKVAGWPMKLPEREMRAQTLEFSFSGGTN